MKNLRHIFFVSLICFVYISSIVLLYEFDKPSESYWIDAGHYSSSFAGGNGSTSNPYKIENASQLARFARLVNKSTSNIYAQYSYSLTSNIDLNGNLWAPIGTNIRPFSGSFIGNGYTIYNMNINTDCGYQGFFGYLTGTAKEFGLNGTITTSAGIYIGGIVAYNSGEITKVSAYVDVDAKASDYVGGVCGYNAGTITESCSINKNIFGKNAVGGIIGGTIESLINNYNTSYVFGVNFVGGITGGFFDGHNGFSVKNCYNLGTINGTNYVGGIVGNFCNIFDSITGYFPNIRENEVMNKIEYCFNKGYVDGTEYIGGIAGILNAEYSHLTNYGQISGTKYIGGICGRIVISMNKNYLDYYNDSYGGSYCSNSGKIIGKGNYIGGIVGLNDNSSITSMFNSGEISGKEYIGGISANNYTSKFTITYCGNSGSITGNKYVGGVCGDCSYYILSSCYNTGTVKGKIAVGGVAGIRDFYTSGILDDDNNVYYGYSSNCYNTGNVSSTALSNEIDDEYYPGVNLGGIFGYTSGCKRMSNFFNTGTVTAPSCSKKYVGSMVGRNNSNMVENSNFYFLGGSCNPNKAFGTKNESGRNDSNGTASEKTEYDMDSSSFATTLGSAFVYDWQVVFYFPYLKYAPLSGYKVSLAEQNNEIWNQDDLSKNDGNPYFLNRYW